MSDELRRAAEAMTTWWDETVWLPFVEAENCNITGPGHQHKRAFAAMVTEWDHRCGAIGPEWPEWTAHDVAHLWVTSRDDWQTWHVAPRAAVGAVPVTCIWGKR